MALAVLDAFTAMIEHLGWRDASVRQIAGIDAWHEYASEASALAVAAGCPADGDAGPSQNSLNHRGWKDASAEIIDAFQEQASQAHAVAQVRQMAADAARAVGNNEVADMRQAEADAAMQWSQMAAYCAEFGKNLVSLEDSIVGPAARALHDAGGSAAAGTVTAHHA